MDSRREIHEDLERAEKALHSAERNNHYYSES